jgi:hypothetical protein
LTVVTPQHELFLPLLSSLNPMQTGETVLSINVTFPASTVDLWWPNGMGQQPLYDVLVGFAPPHSSQQTPRPTMIKTRIGKDNRQLAKHVSTGIHLSSCIVVISLRFQVFEQLRW